MFEMGAPFNNLEVASFMTCSKGYMGECGIRGGYAEVVNMDPGVMAMLQKSISAKLCPTVIGQACMDVVVNPPKPGDPSHDSWSGEVSGTLASYAERAKLVADTLNSIEVSNPNIAVAVKHHTFSRASPVIQCRVQCMRSLRLLCRTRLSLQRKKLVSQLTFFTLSNFWKQREFVLFQDLDLVSSQELSTSGTKILH